VQQPTVPSGQALTLDFSDKVVLITGATRGIGAVLARDFRDAGADLILTGTDPARITDLNRANAEKGIQGIHYFQADFDDDASLQCFLEQIDRYPRIDVCVNNAGINKNNLISDIMLDDYDRITRVNLRAPALICRTVCRKMQAARYGRIVNIASIWSVVSKARRSVYAATKAGLVGLTRTIAADMAPYNVLVNAVSPGFTLTELTEATLSPQEMRELAAQVPLNRFAQPSEIAKVVLFLASDLNTYLTGQNIVVDGGFTSV
jgi:3-oxoacyl-[acyl-carrier protein] reductase